MAARAGGGPLASIAARLRPRGALQLACAGGVPQRQFSSQGEPQTPLLQGLLREARSNSHLLAGAGVALVAMHLYNTYGGEKPDEDPGPLLSLMTWNILARSFTKYNREHHRGSQALEEENQTRERYLFAAEQIAATSFDLVLLQECEESFFESKWNPAAQKLLERYAVFPCRKEGAPGTAVLVRKNGKATAVSDKPICIGGGEESGGSSKIATMVGVKVGSQALNAVSVHFAFDGQADKRLHHARLIGDRLSKKGGAAIVGGDFNCQPGPNLEALQKESFLKKLRRVELPFGTNTGLTGDLTEQVCIDHIYMSEELPIRNASALGWPKSPWGGKVTRPAKVSGASDHVPVWVEIER